jgi:outer membrane cobalamin receptor
MTLARRWPLAVACACLLIFFTIPSAFAISLAQASAASDDVAAAITGTVVDQVGRPLPRAYVKAIDPSGTETNGVFANEAGRFRLSPAPQRDCRLEASLTGFQTSVVPCTGDSNVRIVLAIAPLHDSIVVTPTRTDAPASQVGSSVTIFTADDLDRRQTPLIADLLSASPGAMVMRTGGAGTLTSLFTRGGESSYNKVLLDGIPLNDPGGTFNFANLTTEHLDRVEFVRGAQSALFGTDAMASVVQLFTRRADPSAGRPHVTLALDGGTYSTVHGSGSVSGTSGPLDYSFGVARYETDNRVPNNAFHSTALSVNLGVALSPTATLRFIGRGELGRVGTPGQTAFGRPDLDAFYKHDDGVGGVTFEQRLSASLRQRVTYALAVSNQQSTNLVLDPPYTPAFEGRQAPFQFFDFLFDNVTNLHRHHLGYQADWHLPLSGQAAGDHLLTVVADWDGERAQLEDRRAGSLIRASRDNVGFSVQHQALWRRAFLTVGARVERNDSFGTAAVPRGSIVVPVHQSAGWMGDTRVKASAGLGIKEPTILQSFSPSPSFLGNPDLQPERARTLEGGIEQRLARDRAKVDLTWFDNRFQDLISTRTTSFNPYRSQYFNIGRTSARGFELVVEASPMRQLHGRGGYTFLDSEILQSTSPGNVVFQQGQWLFRRPRHSGFAELTWTAPRLTIDLTGVLIGRFVDSDFVSLQPPLVSNPGYTRWDARVSYRVSAYLAAVVAIDNLADADYMEPLGYLAPRRAARAGFRIGF